MIGIRHKFSNCDGGKMRYNGFVSSFVVKKEREIKQNILPTTGILLQVDYEMHPVWDLDATEVIIIIIDEVSIIQELWDKQISNKRMICFRDGFL